MLWQWSKGSKFRRSDWMHCLTYLDYSNNNQQCKKPCKLDAKNTGRLSTHDYELSHQLSATVQCRTASRLRVHCLPQPLRASWLKVLLTQAFHQLPLKTAQSVLGVTWTVGPTMRRLLRTWLGKCAVVISCLQVILHNNVALYTTFVPVKFCTQTVYFYNLLDLAQLQ